MSFVFYFQQGRAKDNDTPFSVRDTPEGIRVLIGDETKNESQWDGVLDLSWGTVPRPFFRVDRIDVNEGEMMVAVVSMVLMLVVVVMIVVVVVVVVVVLVVLVLVVVTVVVAVVLVGVVAVVEVVVVMMTKVVTTVLMMMEMVMIELSCQGQCRWW